MAATAPNIAKGRALIERIGIERYTLLNSGSAEERKEEEAG